MASDKDVKKAGIILTFYSINYLYSILNGDAPLFIFSTIWFVLLLWQSYSHEKTEERLKKYKNHSREDAINSQNKHT